MTHDDLSLQSLPLFSPAPRRHLAPHASEQAIQFVRVEGRIADLVAAFCFPGRVFHASDLCGYVADQAGGSPESAMRVMRAMRKAGQLDVELLSRSESKYAVRAGRAAGAGLNGAP